MHGRGRYGAIDCRLKQRRYRREVDGSAIEVTVQGVDGKPIMRLERLADPRGEVLAKGLAEHGAIVASDVEEDCDRERIITFEPNGEWMKRAAAVKCHVNLARVDGV
jgi:hypothetical protein